MAQTSPAYAESVFATHGGADQQQQLQLNPTAPQYTVSGSPITSGDMICMIVDRVFQCMAACRIQSLKFSILL